MGNISAVTIIIVIVAFIVGYIIVGAIIDWLKKGSSIKSQGNLPGNYNRDPFNKGYCEDSFYNQYLKNTSRTNQPLKPDYSIEEQTHAFNLGISLPVNLFTIRQQYLDMLSRYHYDKFSSLGDEFKRMAEKKTKEINDAYNYFKRKYNIPS